MIKNRKLMITKILWSYIFKGPKCLLFLKTISWEVNNAESKVISQHKTFKKTYKKCFLFQSDQAGRLLTSFVLLWYKNLCNVLLFSVFKLHLLLYTLYIGTKTIGGVLRILLCQSLFSELDTQIIKLSFSPPNF